jgi:DNA-binding MarR family transcriptional regulator
MDGWGRAATAEATGRPEPDWKRTMPLPESALPFERRLGTLIKQAEHALMAEKNRVLRPFGLTVPQYSALLILSEHPSISGARLARLCGVTAQAMNGVVNLLEQRGLISRAQSADHAKVVLLGLTPAGESLLQQADQEAIAVEQRLAGAYTTTEVEQLRARLVTAIDALTVSPAQLQAEQADA